MSWSHVQGTGAATSTAVTSVTATFSGSVAVGDLVRVAIAVNRTIASVADSGSNAYSLVATAGSGSPWVYIYESVVTTGGTLSVTVTFSSAGPGSIGIDEYSFAGTHGTTATQTKTGSSTTPNVSAITFAGNALDYFIVGTGTSTSGTAPTAPTGYASRYWVDLTASQHYGLGVFDKVNDNSGSTTPSATYPISITWVAAGAATPEGAAAAAYVPYHLLFAGLNTPLRDTP